MQTLGVWHPLHHFLSENACAALSENSSLKKLSIPVPAGLHRIGCMASLATLHLQGLTEDAPHAEPAIEERDAHDMVYGLRLESLQLTRAKFRANAVALLLAGIRADKLCLTEITLDARAVSAFLPNRYVTDLELEAVQMDSASAIALASHPSLVRLSMRITLGDPDEQLSLAALHVLRAAGCASGRSPSQLGGVLALE